MSYKLYLGDCLEVLPTLSEQVDAIITDLPYGTTACKWDTVIPFEPMWAEVKRLLKKRGAFVTTASQPFTSALVMSNPKWFRYEWVWSKNTGGNPMVIKYQPNRTHENILVFAEGATTYNPQKQPTTSDAVLRNIQRGAIIRRKNSKSNHTPIKMTEGSWSEFVFPRSVQNFASVPRATGSLHPTQKPVALYEYLIRTYTNPGDTVLDFVMGSGTTGVACLNTGRNFIGIEKDAGYFAIAEKRLAEAEAQIPMIQNA